MILLFFLFIFSINLSAGFWQNEIKPNHNHNKLRQYSAENSTLHRRDKRSIDCDSFSCKHGYKCGKRGCIPYGHNECPDYGYCESGYYCGKIWTNKCIPNGKTECQHFDGSCDNKHYCGRRQCIPNGHEECADGNYCDSGYYCGKHTDKCVIIGNTECQYLDGSCRPGYYCGKKTCVPIGGDECSSGGYCDPGYHCSQFRPGKCYPNGHEECSSTGGYCDPGYHCSQFRPGKCYSNIHTECQHFDGSCDSQHYCGRRQCIPNGREECPSGAYCDSGNFCSKLHPGKCIPVGNVECLNFNGSCDNQHFCGKLHPGKCIPNGNTECSDHANFSCNPGSYCGKKTCVPNGHAECPDGLYCKTAGYVCGKIRPEQCFPPDHVECHNFNGSCDKQHYCGKKQCIPLGHSECANGRTCDQNNFCAEHSEACIPRGHAECLGANELGYCRAGMQCLRGVCVPEGRKLCADGVHHCDQQEQVCDSTFSVIHPTNATRGCLYKDVAKCEEYRELENMAHCGPKGYLLGFGFNYCRRFYAHFYVLDTKEQNTLGCITECLLQSVRQYLSQQTNVDCAELTSAAKASERQCYQKCELCALTIPYAHPFWSIIKDGRISMDERKVIAQMCDDLGYANHMLNNNPDEEDN